MKHLILGTAGHVDHGKTALVKALTGIDCDTHKEEKRRGITINLGFTSLKLPSGDTIGIVDVPGHRDFVHTMVAGASGIDIALLLVAADSGVMPQTREHLRIMQILGVRSGIIVISRIDLADHEVTDMAETEVRELVKGTFLENAPIVRVSSKTGEGIDELKETIARAASEVRERADSEVFRMYIDRVFSVSGYGTVVTGSVIGGTVKTGSTVYLLPRGRELKLRRLERYGNEVEEVTAGDRASLNLSGVSREETARGMLVSDRLLRSSMLLDANFSLFESGKTLKLWSRAVFLLGTFESQARIHLLDKQSIRAGECAIVQIHLEEPCTAQIGDRFVLRSSSCDTTLGGGEIIDASPLHHRRRSSQLIERLKKLSTGKLPELITSEVKKNPGGISLKSLAERLNISYAEIVSTELSCIIRLQGEKDLYLIDKADLDIICSRIIRGITDYHKKNPLASSGPALEELQGILPVYQGQDGKEILGAILMRMVNQEALRKEGHRWSLHGHHAASGLYVREIDIVERFFKDCGLKTPLLSELELHARRNGLDNHLLRQIIQHLISAGLLYKAESDLIHSSIVDSSRITLLRKLKETPEGLTVAAFRDLISANRKLCLLLLSIYDKEGVTERRGDMRVITKKGLEVLDSTP